MVGVLPGFLLNFARFVSRARQDLEFVSDTRRVWR